MPKFVPVYWFEKVARWLVSCQNFVFMLISLKVDISQIILSPFTSLIDFFVYRTGGDFVWYWHFIFTFDRFLYRASTSKFYLPSPHLSRIGDVIAVPSNQNLQTNRFFVKNSISLSANTCPYFFYDNCIEKAIFGQKMLNNCMQTNKQNVP